MSKTFPNGFIWGAAAAAHQVEGHNSNSDCWLEENVPGSPYVDKSGDSVDQYHRYREDIALMAGLGLGSYRLSVEWARIEPSEGVFSDAELAHYSDVVQCCLDHGLEPLVTLHHFSSPQWLLGLGGWHGERTPALFARYTERVMAMLGGRVKRIITLNECNIGVLLRSIFEQIGMVPPVGIDVKAWRAPEWREAAAKAVGTDAASYCNFQMAGDELGMATIEAAHLAARAVIRRVAPGVQVGLALALSHVQYVPGGEQQAAKAWHGNFRRWLPVMADDDFLGLHNYTRFIYNAEGPFSPPGAEMTQAGYEYTPDSLAAVVRAVAAECQLPIYVTENGLAGDDDTRRIAFVDRALAGLHACIADGVDVRGYWYWSILDNFEWVFGFGIHFGLVAVDRRTQTRHPKPSAHHYGAIARSSTLPAGAEAGRLPGDFIDMSPTLRYTPPTAEPGTVFTHVRIFDGSGSLPFAGEVRVDGNRITAVARDGASVSRDNAQVINGQGGVLMPGLTEAHAHLTWPTSVEKFVPGMSLPPDELVLTAARNARILLDHGFTSAYSAGALGKRIEPALKEQIDSGGMPGPRLVASSIEREPPTDGTLVQSGQVDEHGAGPANVAAFVKNCKDIGAKAVKFLISGESALKPGASLELLYTEEELMAAGQAARENDVWLTGHAHAAEAVKLGVKAGFRVLYHCTYADEEALDLLESVKDRIFIAPSIGIIQATLDAAPPPHFDMTHMKQDAALVLETQKKLVPELRRRGLRLLPGGDYGFPFNPNGRNARDLELWVQHFGYTPAEVLHAATALGGEIMGRGDELGQVKEGFLADLLLVDGDPTANVAILQNKHHLKAIMKDGRFYKAPAGAQA
jgi:beta-glucosidase/6-phospho-beta-glucosidase/beta-galactosidase/imidazolonepropionase-like amidohydrolase